MSFSGWKEVNISDIILSSNTGLDAIKRAPIVDYDSGIKCLRIQDISQVKEFDNWGYCDVEDRNFTKFQLKKGEIIIARTGATIGVNMLIKKDLQSVFNNGLIRIRVEPKFITSEYLYYNLQTNLYKGHILAISGGTSTQPNMKMNDLLYYKIKLPSIYEQEAITSILTRLDEKIEVNNQINKTLENMAQAIFKQWFVDFEFPNEAGEPYKSSGGEMVESELGMIPEGWGVKEISELCDVCSSKRIFASEYVDKGVPFYRGKEIIQKSKGNDISTELFITEEKYNEIKETYPVPREGEMLLTSVGTLGVPYLVMDEEFYFKDGNLTWFKDYIKEGYREYIFLWIQSKKGVEELDAITIGSTQKALTITVLKKMKVVMCNDELLEKFFHLCKSIIDKIQFNNKEKRNLIKIRDTLLPKLMSGEIRVPLDSEGEIL